MRPVLLVQRHSMDSMRQQRASGIKFFPVNHHLITVTPKARLKIGDRAAMLLREGVTPAQPGQYLAQQYLFLCFATVFQQMGHTGQMVLRQLTERRIGS